MSFPRWPRASFAPGARLRAGDPFDVSPVRLRFLRAFENMRRDAALFQRLAELDAQEAGGGVARDARIEAVGQAAHHGRIFVEQFRHDREIVVVDDRVDPPAEPAELGLDGAGDRVDVGAAAQREALQIDEEQVLLLVEGETLIERDREHVVAQIHRALAEDPRVHRERIARDRRLEIHQREDVALDVDAGRDFDQLEPPGRQRKDAALGDVEHALPARGRVGAAERHVLHGLDEFARLGLLQDRQACRRPTRCAGVRRRRCRRRSPSWRSG